jgi:hypothetical protein
MMEAGFQQEAVLWLGLLMLSKVALLFGAMKAKAHPAATYSERDSVAAGSVLFGSSNVVEGPQASKRLRRMGAVGEQATEMHCAFR